MTQVPSHQRVVRLPVPASHSPRRIGPGRRLAAEFQPDAVELEEQQPANASRLTLYAVAALIAAAAFWASFSEFDDVVTAPGRLLTTAPSLVVQPFESSVIRSIDAHVGDVVKAGARLAILDPTFAEADVTQLRTRLASASAQVDRLEAELGGGAYRLGPNSSSEARLQSQLFAERRAYYDAQLASFDQRVEHARSAIATAQSDIGVLATQLEIVRDIEGMRGKLVEKQYGSKLNLLQARYSRLDVEHNLAHLRGSLAELEHEVGEAGAERQAFIENFRRTALEDAVKARMERDQAAEELRKAALRRQMLVLTAPADAVVLEVAQRSIGSVVREAEALFTLVPLNVPLEAEVSIEARDIGHVAVGRPVRLKFDAFPFQKHGTASGVVRTITQDVFLSRSGEGKPEDGRAFYRARIQLTDTRLRSVPANFRLIPGMGVSAEIKAGRRTMMSYLLYPLLRGLDESFREP